LSLCLAALSGLSAQEAITPLMGNPRAAEYYRAGQPVRKSAGATTLTLPVFDDFSSAFVEPDPAIWTDRYAFINNSYGIDPVTNGVATLDAVDSDGSIYAGVTFDPLSFVADHLTSHPVMLAHPVEDSIYLSFLYQPGGLGDLPEEQDSLLVDFFDPAADVWINVWGTPGTALHPFRQVMIPVTDGRFLADGFRFRFRNRASLPNTMDYPDKRANVDHWQIDYIRLDRNRFASDTILRDVAFTSPLNSVLKELSALPWSHFEKAYNTVLDPSAFARYRNNDTIPRNVTRSLTIEEPLYNESYTAGSPTAQDLPALEDTVVEFSYIYPLDFRRGDSAILRFRAALRTDEFDPRVNDTVVHDQVFKDYYAYDDGTPEAGYGLRGQGTRNGSVAIKYHSYQPDELGGVDISFNQLYDSVNLGYYFKLMVWDDNEGVPGSVLLEDGNDHVPAYLTSFPGFIRYHFSEPVQVDGTFYVGWRQYNEFMLNVGLDLNNRPSPHVMFYNYQGSWEISAAPGVMMFRPFLYDETTGQGAHEAAGKPVRIYPNPASDRVTFHIPGDFFPGEMVIDIYDPSGRLVDHRVTGTGSLDVSQLPVGIYFLRMHAGGSQTHAKLLINR
jgi:hypothetical protein